jgi:hypothetical protein
MQTEFQYIVLFYKLWQTVANIIQGLDHRDYNNDGEYSPSSFTSIQSISPCCKEELKIHSKFAKQFV